MCNMCDVCKVWVYENYPWLCMKCFLKHAYVLEVLHEVERYDCMSIKMQRVCIMNHNVMYAHKNACQEWNYACLTEMRSMKWAWC